MMMIRTSAIFVIILFLTVLASGCRESSESAGGSSSAPASANGFEWYQVNKAAFPALGELDIDLDDNRINLRAPKDWNFLPKSDDCLIRYNSIAGHVPMLMVRAEDESDFTNIDRLNLDSFAKSVRDAQNLKSLRLIELGDVLGVTYSQRRKDKALKSFDHCFVVTVIEGRRYTFSIASEEGELDKSRDNLFALVNGMKVLAERTKPTANPEPVATPEPKVKTGEQPVLTTPPEVKPEPKPEPKKEEKPAGGSESDIDRLKELLRDI